MYLKNLPNHNFNINLDSDGVLSYMLLKKIYTDCNLNGYTNSDNFIWTTHNTMNDAYKDVFVDIFIPKKEVVCIDQHVISRKNKDLDTFGENKINPHILMERHHALDDSYCTKFPFQTFLLIMALLEREYNTAFDDVELETKIPIINKNITFCDLILRADGVLENYVKYKKNITRWSKKLIEFSGNGKKTTNIIEYLFKLSEEEALYKTKEISDFYKSYDLKRDGGYNSSFDFEKNLKTINLFMRSYSKFMNIELCKKEETLYEFVGKTYIFEKDIINYIDLNELDSFAFIKNDKLSCTTDFKPNCCKYNVVMYY